MTVQVGDIVMRMKFKSLNYLAILCGFALAACGSGGESPQANSTSDPVPASTPTQQTQPVKTVDRGKVLYKKCQTCHTLEEDGKHKVGPNLHGVIGAVAGQKDGFNYSKVMASSEIVWTDENLDAYMERPSKFMPGNQMAFVGIRKPEDRKLLIEYIKKETGAE